MERKFTSVLVDDIELDAERFRFSFSLRDENLERSIECWGLMHPLALFRGENGRLKLVSGFKRFDICLSLGFSALPCTILEYTKREVWLYLLNDNLFRTFSEVEKASLISKVLGDIGDTSWILTELFPLLGLSKSRKILEDYLSAGLISYGLKEIAHQKTYPLRFLVFLSTFPDQDLVSQLLSKISCGHNKVSHLLLWLKEIMERDCLTLFEILDKDQIKDIIEGDYSPAERGERLKAAVKGLRFPLLKEVEDSFKLRIKKLGLVKNVSLSPPKHMEGKKLSFCVTAASSDELLRGGESLIKVSKKIQLESHFFPEEMNE